MSNTLVTVGGTDSAHTTGTGYITKDTHINQADADANYGGSTMLSVRDDDSAGEIRTLLEITLPQQPEGAGDIEAFFLHLKTQTTVMSSQMIRVLHIEMDEFTWTEGYGNGNPPDDMLTIAASAGDEACAWSSTASFELRSTAAAGDANTVFVSTTLFSITTGDVTGTFKAGEYISCSHAAAVTMYKIQTSTFSNPNTDITLADAFEAQPNNGATVYAQEFSQSMSLATYPTLGALETAVDAADGGAQWALTKSQDTNFKTAYIKAVTEANRVYIRNAGAQTFEIADTYSEGCSWDKQDEGNDVGWDDGANWDTATNYGYGNDGKVSLFGPSAGSTFYTVNLGNYLRTAQPDWGAVFTLGLLANSTGGAQEARFYSTRDSASIRPYITIQYRDEAPAPPTKFTLTPYSKQREAGDRFTELWDPAKVRLKWDIETDDDLQSAFIVTASTAITAVYSDHGSGNLVTYDNSDPFVLTDSGKAWTTNEYSADEVVVLSGSALGTTATISSNTATTITVDASLGMSDGDHYAVVPKLGILTTNLGVAFVPPDSADDDAPVYDTDTQTENTTTYYTMYVADNHNISKGPTASMKRPKCNSATSTVSTTTPAPGDEVTLTITATGDACRAFFCDWDDPSATAQAWWEIADAASSTTRTHRYYRSGGALTVGVRVENAAGYWSDATEIDSQPTITGNTGPTAIVHSSSTQCHTETTVTVNGSASTAGEDNATVSNANHDWKYDSDSTGLATATAGIDNSSIEDSPKTLKIASSAAGDTDKDWHFYGLDGYGLEIDETITTNNSNGTTSVAGSKYFSKVTRIVGEGECTGTITLQDSGSTTIATAKNDEESSYAWAEGRVQYVTFYGADTYTITLQTTDSNAHTDTAAVAVVVRAVRTIDLDQLDIAPAVAGTDRKLRVEHAPVLGSKEFSSAYSGPEPTGVRLSGIVKDTTIFGLLSSGSTIKGKCAEASQDGVTVTIFGKDTNGKPVYDTLTVSASADTYGSATSTSFYSIGRVMLSAAMTGLLTIATNAGSTLITMAADKVYAPDHEAITLLRDGYFDYAYFTLGWYKRRLLINGASISYDPNPRKYVYSIDAVVVG